MKINKVDIENIKKQLEIAVMNDSITVRSFTLINYLIHKELNE